jgi:hypothetical protein
MRYLVTARVKPGREAALLEAIEQGKLGAGSVAGDEYLHDMAQARVRDEMVGSAGRPIVGRVQWVEVCFCGVPLEEERPYWEEYFDLVRVQDAHPRRRCRDLDGSEPWACSTCDCTVRLDERMTGWGRPFLEVLREKVRG